MRDGEFLLTPNYAADARTLEEQKKQDKQDKDYERFAGRVVNDGPGRAHDLASDGTLRQRYTHGVSVDEGTKR